MKDVKEITAQLEEGIKNLMESDKFVEYLNFVGKFHSYSFNNICLILSQCPEATHVAGFQTWKKKFDRNVRKGEKAIWILAPMPRSVVKKSTDKDGNETEETISWTAYRPVSVFDISQTDGKEVPTTSDFCITLEGNAEGFQIAMDKLTKFVDMPVEYEVMTDGSHGYFDPVKRRIAINKGMSERQTLKTTVHEVAHALLHGIGGEEENTDRRTQELQAESVAYTVCNYMGLDTSDYSFGYIASWAKEKDVKELQKSLNIISKTANEIITAIA